MMVMTAPMVMMVVPVVMMMEARPVVMMMEVRPVVMMVEPVMVTPEVVVVVAVLSSLNQVIGEHSSTPRRQRRRPCFREREDAATNEHRYPERTKSLAHRTLLEPGARQPSYPPRPTL